MINNLCLKNKKKIDSIDKIIYELEENYFNMENSCFNSRIDKINKDLEKLEKEIKIKKNNNNEDSDKEILVLSIENLSKRICNIQKLYLIQKAQTKNPTVKTNFNLNLDQTETKLLFSNNLIDYNQIVNNKQENTNIISSPNEQFEEIILTIDEPTDTNLKYKKGFILMIGIISIIFILVIIIIFCFLL